MDYQWIIIGLSMDYQWIINGLSMDYQWIINGLSMDYQWIIMDYHGLSWIIMDYHGLSMDYQWIIMDYRHHELGTTHEPSIEHPSTAEGERMTLSSASELQALILATGYITYASLFR